MKRLGWLLFPCALLACSQQQEEATQAEPQSPRSKTEAGPDIGITQVPGIALSYVIRFRMPAAAISAVQERHAAACEQLGQQRCRITGLRYRADARRAVVGELDLALEPAIARAFGRTATLAVVEAKGSLLEQKITSEDAGAVDREAQTDSAAAAARLRELERRLADRNTRAEERAVLAQETAALRQRLDDARQTRSGAAATLATTPMHFDYEAGDLVPGFDLGAPVRNALAGAAGQFVQGIAGLIYIFATLLPWALALGLGLFTWRRLIAPRLSPVPPPAE